MKKSTPIWLTIVIALIALVAGIIVDRQFLTPKPNPENDPKVNAILNLIAQEYVDTVNLDLLVENSIFEILSKLDPHTSYFDARSPKTTTVKYDGVIPDIGIVFIMFNDSIYVECTIPAGPGDIAGILPGDRIVKIDGQPTTNIKNTSGEVFKLMSGPDGSQLTLGVQRPGNPKILNFTVTRNKVIERTLDSYYLLDKNTGYIKVNQFENNTYKEFLQALT